MRNWLASLMSLLPMFWTGGGRPPGPPTGGMRPRASRVFTCQVVGEPDNRFFEIRTDAAKLDWLSDRICGFSMQSVDYRDGMTQARESPVNSLVSVTMVSHNVAKLEGLEAEVEGLLRQGQEYYALVTSSLRGIELHKERELLIEGDGKGSWIIRKM